MEPVATGGSGRSGGTAPSRGGGRRKGEPVLLSVREQALRGGNSGRAPRGGAAATSKNIQELSLSTVMENSASSTGSSPPRSVFCSKCEMRTASEEKGKEHVEKVLEECSQKRPSKTTERREQQKINLRLVIDDLHTKWMEMQLERDALQDTRQKESQSQENVKMQLKNTIRELGAANQLQEELLREADSQTEHLRRMVHSHEEVLLELRGILRAYEDSTGKKLDERETVTSPHTHSLSTAFADVLRDLDSEVSYLKERVVLVEGELETLKKDSQTQNLLLLQQHQNSKSSVLPCSRSPDVPSYPPESDLFKTREEQTRTQNSVHAHQGSHLESTVSQLHSELREAKRMYEDKVKDLEKQLHLAPSEVAEAQTDQDQRSQESGSLNERIHQLVTELHKKEIELSLEKEQNRRFWDRHTESSITVDQLRRELDSKTRQLRRLENTVEETRAECHRQTERQVGERLQRDRNAALSVAAVKEKNESVGRISSLTVQLESTKETLRKVQEDLAAKQVDLERAEKAAARLRACLQEKERALEVTSREVKRLRSQAGSRTQELRPLRKEEAHLPSVQSECETLKLQVLEKERIVEIFQKQIDTMTQIVGRHSQTAGAVQVEKAQLIKEINAWKCKAEELKIAKDEKGARVQEMESRLRELELEKVQLVNTCAERLRALNDVKLEKEQLRNQLQASRSALAGLAEGFENLKRDYQDKIKEMENTARRLKMQVKSARAEVAQTRTALKAIEGSDGNAMRVAAGMQKKITAKRGQIDALQSKIKFLEEAMTNAAKEKHYLREDKTRLSQEMSYITAENTKIAGELEILRSQDKRLKEKISKMEAALDKASTQFAECQRMIQRQEQEVMRFRLQHTLDLKELQGPGYSSASAPGQLRHAVPVAPLHSAPVPPSPSSAGSAPPMPSKPGVLKGEPLQDVKRILRGLAGSDNDLPRAELGKEDSSGGKKSPVAAVSNTGETAASDSATESIVEKAARGRDPSSLHAADLQAPDVTQPSTALGGASIFSAAPRYTSSPKKISREERYRERSPVHVLLTSSPDDLAAGPSTSPERRPCSGKAGSPEDAATGPQITVSAAIGAQEMKLEKAKGKEKKVSA